jgi:MbtH protein
MESTLGYFDDEDPGQTYRVLVNAQEQYSLWPSDLDVPAGWQDTGKSGTKAECAAYVDEVWTDMRPRSLREQMDEDDRGKNDDR